MLYSRLVRMKNVSDDLGDTKPRSAVKNQVALELGLRKDAGMKEIPIFNVAHLYFSCNYDRKGSFFGITKGYQSFCC